MGRKFNFLEFLDFPFHFPPIPENSLRRKLVYLVFGENPKNLFISKISGHTVLFGGIDRSNFGSAFQKFLTLALRTTTPLNFDKLYLHNLSKNLFSLHTYQILLHWLDTQRLKDLKASKSFFKKSSLPTK